MLLAAILIHAAPPVIHPLPCGRRSLTPERVCGSRRCMPRYRRGWRSVLRGKEKEERPSPRIWHGRCATLCGWRVTLPSWVDWHAVPGSVWLRWLGRCQGRTPSCHLFELPHDKHPAQHGRLSSVRCLTRRYVHGDRADFRGTGLQWWDWGGD